MGHTLTWDVLLKVRLTFLLMQSLICIIGVHASNIKNGDVKFKDTENFKMDTWKYQKKFLFTESDKNVWKQDASIKIDKNRFDGKNIYVHVIPWTHADPGYKSSYTNSFNVHTSKILTSVVNSLSADPSRRFIWAEAGILQRWYASASTEVKDTLKTLIHNGQFEIVSGGWVMPEEALTHYESLLEELMEGHDWMIRALGVRPKVGFSMDSIGHSPVMSYLLKKSGLKGTVINKIHYAYKSELAGNRSLEFMWTPSWSDNSDDKLFTHVHPFDSFDIIHSCGPNPSVCSAYDFTSIGKRTTLGNVVDPIKSQNIDSLASGIADQYMKQAMLFRTNHIPVFIGGTSYYESEKDLNLQFDSYQKLFNYINSDPKYGMHIAFSNLSYWFSTVQNSKFYPNNEKDMPVVRGDFFNYADTGNDFWTGHYSTRTFFKKFSRGVGSMSKSVNSLFALLTAFGREPSDKADLPIIFQRARRSVALYQNHHGISGVSSKAAMREYVKNMHESRWKMKNTFLLLVQHALSREGFPTTAVGDDFELSEKKKRFNEIIAPGVINIPKSTDDIRTLVFYNNLPHTRSEYVSVRVDDYNVEIRNADGDIVVAQICPTFESSQDKLSIINNIYTITFPVRVPALGVTTMFISRAIDEENNNNAQFCEILTASPSVFKIDVPNGAKSIRVLDADEPMCMQNSQFSVCINKSTGLINSVDNGLNKNNDNSAYEKFEEEYLVYGTNTPRDGQVLMSVSDLGKAIKPPTNGISHALFRGIYTDEHAYQIGSRLRVARVIKDTSVVNGINALGLRYVDISIKDSFREDALAMRIKTSVQGRKEYKLKFVTDVNGFGYADRTFRKDLPNSANFFPITTSLRIQDQNQRQAFLVSQPMGATCYKTVADTVTCEFILDRKTHSDDKKGISDKVEDGVPTLSDFRISFEKPDSSELLDSPTVSELSHALGTRFNNPFEMGVGIAHKAISWKKSFGVEIAPLTSDLPLDVEIPNLQVATSALGAGEIALTISRHIVGRHVTERSQKDEVCISLTDLFKCAQVVDVTEHTLTFLHELNEGDNTAIMDGTVCIQKGSIHSYTFNVRIDQDCRTNSMISPRPSKWIIQGETETGNAENDHENPFDDIAFDDNVPPGIPEYQANKITNERENNRDEGEDGGKKDSLGVDIFDENVDFINFNENRILFPRETKSSQINSIKIKANKEYKDRGEDTKYNLEQPKLTTDKKNYNDFTAPQVNIHIAKTEEKEIIEHNDNNIANDKDVKNKNKEKYDEEEGAEQEEEKDEIKIVNKEKMKKEEKEDENIIIEVDNQQTNKQDERKNFYKSKETKDNDNNAYTTNKKYTKELEQQLKLSFPIENIPNPAVKGYNRDRSGKIQLGILSVSGSFLISFFLFIKRLIRAKTFAIILIATALINTMIFLI